MNYYYTKSGKKVTVYDYQQFRGIQRLIEEKERVKKEKKYETYI